MRNALRFLPASLCLATILLTTLTCLARSPLRTVQTFSITNDVGIGNGVYVVGNHPDLGNMSPTGAVKLGRSTGNIWSGQAGVQAGTDLQYKFIKRSIASAQACSAANTTDLSPTNSRSVSPEPAAPYNGKTILYYSTWPRAFIHYRSYTNWLTAEMDRVGPGRTADENLFRISGVGEAGEILEFVPNNGDGQWDNPRGGGNYVTRLDVLFLQSKHVYNYQPPPAPSALPIQTITITSSYPQIPARTIRIYLPRGYAQNTWKRYPVLYLHDGQNVFDPGGPFGSWSVNVSATTEITMGRARECIIVGIDNTANRINEYLPPTDTYQGKPGIGDAYLAYVTNNIFAHVNANYRTLTGPDHTSTAGSSMGGLISLYFGREAAFGKIGIFSPAFWVAPNYLQQVSQGPKRPGRVYLDMGTAEGDSAWNGFLTFQDILLLHGFANNHDSLVVTGCGDQHNEAAWKKRFPGALCFLLDVLDEPNILAQQQFPPRIELLNVGPPGAFSSFAFEALRGFNYELQHTGDFAAWYPAGALTNTSAPWKEMFINGTNPSAPGSTYWRIRATPNE